MATRTQSALKRRVPLSKRQKAEPGETPWAEQLVWKSALSLQHKAVLVVFCRYGDPDGTRQFPSLATVAWWCSLSISQVKRHVRKLVSLGILELIAEADPGDHTPNEYRINVDKLPVQVELHKWRQLVIQRKREAEARRKERRASVTQGRTTAPLSRGASTPPRAGVHKGCSGGSPMHPDLSLPNRCEKPKTAAGGKDLPAPPPADLVERANRWAEGSAYRYGSFVSALTRELEAATSPDVLPGVVTALAGRYGVPLHFAAHFAAQLAQVAPLVAPPRSRAAEGTTRHAGPIVGECWHCRKPHTNEGLYCSDECQTAHEAK